MAIPLLFISDSPTAGTGLGRITRDLAIRVNDHLKDVFRVATLGYGGPYTRSLGFHQYETRMKDWVIYNLPEVWEDFAGEEKGIIMSIWDASRMLWFARPENCPDANLRKFLLGDAFERWGYFPMDATGPNNKLTAILSHTIDAYDRVLGYSKWACEILDRSLQHEGLDLAWRPHGIDTSVFYPRNYKMSRHRFGERINAKNHKGKWMTPGDDDFMIGIVATNQTRKDFGLGIQAVAEVNKKRPVMMWIHTDVLERHWSIPALLYDYGLDVDKVVVTCVTLSEEQMTHCYSACDVTLGIGMSEGFGYPIFESLACGTPCIHGAAYGGAPEHMQAEMLVPAQGTRLEGVYNCFRPIHCYREWAEKIESIPRKGHKGSESLLPPHLDWKNLWPSWEEWFRAGVTNAG